MTKPKWATAILITFLLALSYTVSMPWRVQAASASGDDWPMFHHDPAHTGYTTSEALTTAPVVVWSKPAELIPTRTSPAIVNGVVYASAANLYAYNASTGDEIWSVTGAGYAGSPIVNGACVYCGGIAYNASTGLRLWSPLPTDDYGSQTFANGYLHAVSDKVIVAVNASTGAQIWHNPINYIASAPAVANGVLYLSATDGNFYAFDAYNGTKIWNYTLASSQKSSPAVYGGKVYIGSFDDNVYCLDAVNGTKIWNYTTGFWVDSSPAVAGGVVYVGGFDGNLYALNASTGSKLWIYRVQQPPSGEEYSGLHSSPAVVNGRVYIGSNDHIMLVLGNMSNLTPSPAPSATVSASPFSSVTPPSSPSATVSPSPPASLSPSTITIIVIAILVVILVVVLFVIRTRKEGAEAPTPPNSSLNNLET